MRILQVTPYFHPYVGGQERYVRNLARGLIDRGHAVTVFTSDFPRRKEKEVIDGVEVRRFHFLCRPLNNAVSPEVFFQLIKYRADFDIVHCHNEHAAVSQYCALTKPFSKRPLVITCHGLLRFDHPMKDFFERAYSKTMGARLLRKANRVITISDSDKGYVHSFAVPLEKIEVIPNGIDVSRYNCQRGGFPEGMLFEGKRVILFVGPVIKRKGPQVLVQAIPRVAKENPDVLFVFAGKGDFRAEVERLSRTLHVEQYTRFLGYVPEDQLHYLYQRSEALVLPSFSEALSYTILDAFAFSKPVISSLIPCLKDYLSETALLVQPGDSEALADAVLRLLRDRKLAGELGAKGRRLVETRFTWDAVVNGVEEIYREVLDSS